MSEMIHVPDGWEVKKVSSLCKILDNQRIPLNDEERQNMKGHIPYYGANAIVDYIDSYLFDEDLILLAEDGGNFDEYENRPISFKISGKSWVNNHAHILKPNKNVEFDYVFYSLEHKNITSYIRGGTRSKLNQSDLRDVDVLIPKEKKEQEKIANILSTLDKAIESTNRLIEKEKNIKKALMQELLTNGIDKDGHIRTRATHTYKESELGLIPDEWEVVEFKKAINLIDGDRGTNYPKDEDFSEHGYCVFLSAKNVTKDGFRFNEIQFITKEKDEQLRKGKLVKNDIVLTTRGTVGNIAYFDESVIFQNMRINSGMIILRNQNHTLSNDYLYIFLKSGLFEHQIANTVFGSAQPQLTVKEIEKFSICFPNKTEQKQIAKILTTQDKKIETEETNLAKLKELKKGLMNDLLSGKVRVKV